MSHILTDSDFERVGRVISRGESVLFGSSGEGGATSQRGTNVQVLKVQSGASNAYGYPARIQGWDGSTGTWSDLTTTEVRIADPNGGAFAVGAYVPVGRFLGINASNVGCFSAKFATSAGFIRFALPGTLATTDASKASCTVDDYWGGTDPGATVTVYNLPASSDYMFAGVSGAKGLAVWDEIDSKYWIVQLECGGSSNITINSTEVVGGTTNSLIYTDGTVVQTADDTRIVSEKLELKIASDRWIAFSKGSF